MVAIRQHTIAQEHKGKDKILAFFIAFTQKRFYVIINELKNCI
jgi:hypothetical protein